MRVASPDLLATIVAATRARVDAQAERVPLATVREAVAVAPPIRRFREALARADRVNVIAECKRRSPSRLTSIWSAMTQYAKPSELRKERRNNAQRPRRLSRCRRWDR